MDSEASRAASGSRLPNYGFNRLDTAGGPHAGLQKLDSGQVSTMNQVSQASGVMSGLYRKNLGSSEKMERGVSNFTTGQGTWAAESV